MKRIIAAVAVVAIVSSALAFKPMKGGAYCASNIAANTSCQIFTGKTELNNGTTGTTFFKYNAWNGTQADCLSSRCATQTTFYNE